VPPVEQGLWRYGRESVRRLHWSKPLAAAAALLCVLAALLAATWLAAPRAQNLTGRLAARERATGVTVSVPLPRVSLFLRDALVATEDERFYRNHGIDLIGIARALPYDVVHLSFAEGASTITDQLAKLLYLNGNDHSVWRKLEDLAVALRISTRYSKEQVLDAYLNSVYFGHGAYGIDAASERYFGLPPGRLTLAQGSLIAGLVQAPTAYDPRRHPAAARQRQVEVLQSLVRDGYVTSDQATRVLTRPLPLRHARPLPPLQGVTIASQPAFAWGGLALGSAVILSGLLGFIVIRRRPTGSGVQLAIKLACTLAVLSGAITATDSFRAL
jgi:membrane peptidoglycan carboxypeptidase